MSAAPKADALTSRPPDRIIGAKVKHIGVGAVGAGFDYRTGRTGHIVANVSPLL